MSAYTNLPIHSNSNLICNKPKTDPATSNTRLRALTAARLKMRTIQLSCMFLSDISCLLFWFETHLETKRDALHLQRLAISWRSMGEDTRRLGKEKSAGTLQIIQVSVEFLVTWQSIHAESLFLCSLCTIFFKLAVIIYLIQLKTLIKIKYVVRSGFPCTCL